MPSCTRARMLGNDVTDAQMRSKPPTDTYKNTPSNAWQHPPRAGHSAGVRAAQRNNPLPKHKKLSTAACATNGRPGTALYHAFQQQQMATFQEQ